MEGGAAAGGGIDAGNAGGGSPRSIESSLRVSRSIALTASHDDSDATSIVRSSASGEPTANSWISGPLVAAPAVDARMARMSAWSAGISYPPDTTARAPSASSVVAPTAIRPSLILNGICADLTDNAPAD